MMFFGLMTLGYKYFSLTIRYPECGNTISLIRFSFIPFDVFDDDIVFIDDGYERHSVVLYRKHEKIHSNI